MNDNTSDATRAGALSALRAAETLLREEAEKCGQIHHMMDRELQREAKTAKMWMLEAAKIVNRMVSQYEA